MIARAERSLDHARRYFDTHPNALDALLIAIVTLVAGALRLARLGDIPYGVHPDEAQIGTDAFRVMDDGWIGVYSHAALGVPTLNAYLTTPAIWLLGHTAFSLRLPLALVGLAAVPLTYLVVRVGYRRSEAFFASLMLAISYWHVFYSRVAHSSISYPTILLGAVLCIMLGLNSDTRRTWWFVASGALLGLGIYAYNVDAIAIVAVAAFFAVMTLLRARRGEDLRRWGVAVGACFGTALVVALPFIIYISDPGAYYWTHIDDYRNTGVLRTQEYREASAPDKARVLVNQVRNFLAAYAWDGQPDIIDANGLRPMFDPVTLLLFLAGLAIALALRREPLVIASVCFVLILPLPALLQRGSVMREPLGAAPYAMFLAALPLAWAWRRAQTATSNMRALGLVALAVPIAIIATLTVHDYFWTFRNDPLTRFVYHQEMTSAALYMKTLPPDAYIYFYSERHPLSLENRQFLAPDIRGEDRSREFSDADASIDDIDRSRPVVFVLLGDYVPLINDIEAAYPGGEARVTARNGEVDFESYELPPQR